jgi:hypothetical protein
MSQFEAVKMHAYVGFLEAYVSHIFKYYRFSGLNSLGCNMDLDLSLYIPLQVKGTD